MGVLVEICACSAADVLESENGGAHRVELCSALKLGGLTPSAGTISECRKLTQLRIMVMIRPRSGGFAYSDSELASMERDIDIAGELGADGFVFGILRPDGTVDPVKNQRLVKRAGDLPKVFHRAFDFTPNPIEALEAIVDLGMTRLLTSGQRPYSPDGAELIRNLIERAGTRLEVMPGGGVRSHNIAELVRKTGCRQVHLSASKPYLDPSLKANRLISFGSGSATTDDYVEMIDQDVVAAIVLEANKL